jgi:hypothetical protein
MVTSYSKLRLTKIRALLQNTKSVDNKKENKEDLILFQIKTVPRNCQQIKEVKQSAFCLNFKTLSATLEPLGRLNLFHLR